MYRSSWSKLWLLGLVAAATTAAAQPERVVTLQEAHRMAIDNYQLVGAVEEQVQQAEHVRREARSVLMPSVSLQSVVTHNLVTAEFQFGGQTIRVLPGNDYNLALVLSQPVFAGQRLLKAKRQADVGVDAAGQSYETTVQDVLLNVTRAYYTVLAVQDNIEITKRSVDVTQETLRTAESLFRAGESVETAVLRARVAHSDAQRELVEAQNLLEIAKEQLSLLTGIREDFRLERPAKPAGLTAQVEELIEQGLRTRPELRGLELQRDISQLEIERQKGQYFPEIRAVATYLRRRATFPSPSLGSFAVQANWTLFDSGRRSAEVAFAKSRLRELDLRRSLLGAQIEQQIRTAYLNIETRTAAVNMLTEQVEFARKNAESTSKAFRVGEATDLDILVSNETLTRSERQLALATYELELAAYDLRRAMGTLKADEEKTGGTP